MRLCEQIACVCLLQSVWLSGFANEGWLEIRADHDGPLPVQSTGDPSDVLPNRAVGQPGDRLWVVQADDTLQSIARLTTGHTAAADQIARYNAMGVSERLAAGRLLYVPAHLLPPPRSEQQPASSLIQEFGQAGSTTGTPLLADDRQSAPVDGASVAPENVSTVNVDMFVGEVQMFGPVDVTRVAIGNGGVIRAEVLDTGELLVIGQLAGSSSLRLWHTDQSQSDYNVRVSAEDPETRVRMEKMVRMRVHMVEFRKSALTRLGIDWSDSVAGPAFATAGDFVGNNLYRPAADGIAGSLPNTVKPFSTYLGIASTLTSRINLLSSNGDARTLAEPVLSCASGGSASFLAGGEVPYPSVGENGQTVVQFKEYGIKLNVSPRIDAGGNVRTVIETEISQLDPAVSVQGAPGLLTRRAQTEVNVHSGETIVISGLLSAEQGRDVDRLPGIARLPVIGSLFRSSNLRNAVTELVIFVTPEVQDPARMQMSTAERGMESRAADMRSEASQWLELKP